MTRPRRLAAAPFAPLAALLLGACAAQNAPAPSATSVAPPSPAADFDSGPRDRSEREASASDLEGQIAAFSAAEARLDRVIRGAPLGRGRAANDKKSEVEQKHVDEASPPAAPMKAGRPPAPGSYRFGVDDLGGDPCATACSALSSMERAAKHLCDLTGDGDARCGNARSRLSGAIARVTASCPACSSGH